MEENKQKSFIQKLQTISITPLQGAINYYSEKQKKYTPGKREDLNKKEIYDHVTVPSNALIFELDATSYSANQKIAKKLIETLNNRGWKHNIYQSSQKGIHIELYFNPPILSEQQKKLFTEALSYELSFKDVRLWLWNLIIDEAGFNKEYKEKYIDKNCITFDDLQDKTRLLRVVGGRKVVLDKITLEENIYYKTFKKELPKKSEPAKQFINVEYPDNIETFNINPYEFTEFLENYIKHAKNNNKEQLTKINLASEGGYINLDTIKRVREGLGKGQRSTGAQLLAIAMSNDDIPLKKQEQIMTEYVSNCSQSGEPFTIGEAMQWVTWVQTQPNIFWNCSIAEHAGLHEPSLCEYCKKKNKEAIKFLHNKTILKQINDVLDKEIMGENETKMLMFLLLLSKDFPSKTGRPGWNINSDPMAQNVILSSDSSSGKTYMTKKVLQLFGEKNKDYYVISRITKNAINYLTDVNMDGKIIFIEELQGMDEATSQLRIWMSEGELTLKTVEKVKNDDGSEENASVDKTTTGQPVFISNQAEGKIEDQLNNRSWVLGMDTTSNQSSRILQYQDDLYGNVVETSDVDIRKIKDALKQLKQYHFLIPFADYKAMNIPINDLRCRRDYQKFLTLIMCSAYLHQKQRYIVKDEKEKEYIVCDIDDYDIAKEYAHNILGATFSGLTTNQIDILNHIRKSNWSKEAFTVNCLMREMGKTQPYWYGQLKQLTDLGFITTEKQGVGKTTLYNLNEGKIETVINLPDNLLLKRLTYNSAKQKIGVNKYQIVQDPKIDDRILSQPVIGWGVSVIGQFLRIQGEEALYPNIEEKSQPINNNSGVKGNFQHPKTQSKTLSHSEPKFIGCDELINWVKTCENEQFTMEEIEAFFKDKNYQKTFNSLLEKGELIRYKDKYVLI